MIDVVEVSYRVGHAKQKKSVLRSGGCVETRPILDGPGRTSLPFSGLRAQ